MIEEKSNKTFEQMAKETGDNLTKRILSEDFGYCMRYIALGETGEQPINVNLTLRDLKIIELGLEKYKEYLLELFEHGSVSEGEDPFKGDWKREAEECDNILTKLREAQIWIFSKLSEHDISYMYAHKILGPGTLTGGGTIQ